MAHYWGSFAGGFAQGLRNGWDLGEKITSAWEKAKYAQNQKEVNDKYDNLESQEKAKYAQIDALNSGKADAQAETEKAYNGYTPTVESGIREIAAQDPDSGRWTPTVNNKSTEQQTADYKNEHTFVPLGDTRDVKPESVRDAVSAFEKNGEYAPKQEAAMPRFSSMSLDDKLSQYRDERKQALSRLDRDYYSGDPEKSRALRKEAEEDEFNQHLLGVYRGALNGDVDSLKILADNAAAQGLIPEGTQIVPNRDGSFALVTEDGHIYEDETGSYGSVRLSREMIESAFQNYALTQKAYHDKDYKGLTKEQREARKADREDRAMDLKETYLGSKMAASQAAALAKNAGFKAGKWKPNEDGTGIVLYGHDAQGNEDYPLAVAQPDGTGIHPISLDKQWKGMAQEVEKKGFKLGVNDKLEPIVVSPDGQSAASYEDWVDRKAQWTPVADNSPVQPEESEKSSAPKRGLKGFRKSMKQAVTEGPALPDYAKERDKAYPKEYDEEGMDKAAPPEEAPEGGPAPGAEPVTDPFTVAQYEPDWRDYRHPAKEEPKPVAPHGYEPGMAPSMSAPAASDAGDVLQHQYEDRVTDTSMTPPWLLRMQNADRARRGLQPLPSMTERPQGKGTLELLEEVNQGRFSDRSKLSDHARRVIDASKGEPSEEHKSTVAAMNDAVKAEMERRGVDPKKQAALPDRSLFRQTEKSEEPKANPRAVRMGSKDEGVVAGPDIRGPKETALPKKQAAKPTETAQAAAQKQANTPAQKLAQAPKATAKASPKKRAAAPIEENAKITAPVAGKILHKKGDKVYPEKNKWQAGHEQRRKGTAYQVKEGDTVQAMASGRVDFSGWMRGFGNVVIITDALGKNHVYTNTNSKLKQGDRVSAGSTIGTAGYTFEREKGGNYIEYIVEKHHRA